MDEDEERVGQVEQGAELRCDESLVGRRVTVLRWDEDADGEPQAADYHPATVVAFKDSNRKNKFFIHFDKPYAGVTTEKVDLKDSNIRIMFQRVKYCTCSQCATTAEGQCLLPLTDAGVSLAVAHRPVRSTAWQGPPPGEAH